MNGKTVIAVDLDGTLAHWDEKGDYSADKIGEPIKPMLDRVKQWLEDGHEVVIFTARVGSEGAYPHIHAWLRKHGIGDLDITNKKRPDFKEFWDDRAVTVERNTGKVLGRPEEKSWEDEARETVK